MLNREHIAEAHQLIEAAREKGISTYMVLEQDHVRIRAEMPEKNMRSSRVVSYVELDAAQHNLLRQAVEWTHRGFA